MTKYEVRWMIRADMPEVLDIENASFPSPWDESNFSRCLRQRNCIGMVVDWGDRIIGYMVYELHKSRLHLLNFAVHPDCRRRGVGRAMVNKMIGKLSPRRRSEITLEIIEDNLPGQLFFKSMGFTAEEINPNVWGDLATYTMVNNPYMIDAICEQLFS